MSDAFTRLAAADPFARDPYVVDVEDLIGRVTSIPAHETSLWRRFQLRVGTALSTSALVTAGAIAALQGAGSSLPVLNFAAPVARGAYASAVTLAPSTAAKSSSVAATHFRAGPALSNASTQGVAYQLSVPTNPATETARLAAVFRVQGPLSASSDKTSWHAGDTHATLTYFAAGLPSWRYARATQPAMSSGASFRSTRALEATARDLARRLDYGYQLASPHVSFVSGSSPEVHVRFPIKVEGVATNLSLTFRFDAPGVLVGASGPSFLVARSYVYPLVSLRGGVARLNATASPGATQSMSAAPTLRRATLSLEAFQLHNGALWLVPIYTYDEGPHARSASWSLVALAGPYVRHVTSLGRTPLAQP
jgi:hypothetical protein